MQYADSGDLVNVVIFIALVVISLVVRAIKLAGDKVRQTRRNPELGDAPWPAPADTEWEEWNPEAEIADDVPYRAPAAEYNRPPVAAAEGKKTVYQRQMEESESRRRAAAVDFYPSSPPPVPPTDASSECNVPNWDVVRSMEEAMARTFPKARRMARQAAFGEDRRIVLRVRDRKDLRRSVLLKEVLGQPRAFDL